MVTKRQALDIIDNKISVCNKCEELCAWREACSWKTVPGTGNPHAPILIIGEAPGQQEAITGLPFVGRAGKLLTKILLSIGLKREDVFITNTIKCRPPNNRNPKPEEYNNCKKFLELQIRCISPEWIVCLGKFASIYLLEKDYNTSISSLRGIVHNYRDMRVICTYHPSYVLRNPKAKSLVICDLEPIRQFVSSVID